MLSITTVSFAHEISGRVWLDSNGDGLQSAGEKGIPNTNIELYPVGSGDSIARTVSDQNGHYSFTDLDDGYYYLCNDEGFREQGLDVTAQDAGDDTIDNDFDFLPCTDEIEINDELDGVADFGLVGELTVSPGTNTISGTVWLDRNGDGIRTLYKASTPVEELGDFEISASIQFDLYRAGSDLPIDHSTANSRYRFKNVAAGEYFVCAVTSSLPVASSSTLQNIGVDETRDNDFDHQYCTQKFMIDADNEAIADLGLLVTPIGSESFIVGENTACSLQDAIVAATFGVPRGGCPAGNFTNPDTDTINLIAGHRYPPVVIGFVSSPRELKKKVGTHRFTINGNGAYVESITIKSTTSDDNGYPDITLNNMTINRLIADRSTNTLADVTVLSDVVNGYHGHINVANSTLCGVFLNKAQLTDWYYGDQNPCRKDDRIIGRVWLDSNGDGLQSADEAGIAGINLELFYSQARVGGGEPYRSVARLDSNANGEFTFTGLSYGHYFLCYTGDLQLLGLEVTQHKVGNNDLIDSDFDTQACSDDIFVANSFRRDGQADLGLIGAITDPTNPVDLIDPVDPTAGNQITGRVWLDRNGNGQQDPNEPGIPNINVEVYPVGSGDSLASLHSGDDGSFTFTGLIAGEYYLCNNEDFREQGLEVTSQDAGNDSIDNDFDWLPCSNEITVTDNQGGSADFGLVGEITDPIDPIDPINPVDPSDPTAGNQISGRVWLDSNANGQQDSGEPSIPNINIEVYPVGSGDSLASLHSNADGSFTFTGLSAGQYYLCNNEDFREQGLEVTFQDAGNDNLDNDFDFLPCTDEITVSDSQGGRADFGLVGEITDPVDPNAGNQIMGRVWMDSNGDDVQTPGEPGIAGINVELYQVGSGSSIGSLYSNVDGSFTFTGLSAGQYYLCNNGDFRDRGLAVILTNVGDESIDNDFDFLPCSNELTVTDSQGARADFGLADAQIFSQRGQIRLTSIAIQNKNACCYVNYGIYKAQIPIKLKLTEQGSGDTYNIEFIGVNKLSGGSFQAFLETGGHSSSGIGFWTGSDGHRTRGGILPRGIYQVCVQEGNEVPVCFDEKQLSQFSIRQVE